MGMPFVELNFGDKFTLRFIRNADGLYGHWSLDEIMKLQPMIDDAFKPQAKHPSAVYSDDKTYSQAGFGLCKNDQK